MAQASDGLPALTPEISPLGLYTRLFGAGFQDPSKGEWKPDPEAMLQKSVLSVVADDRKVYRVTRIIENRIVELKCINQPTMIYVAIKDLYNYFIGTTGAARQ